jgi:hypothetical protein
MNLKTPRTPIGTVATLTTLWQGQRTLKTIAPEDIYADPHKFDSFLDSGESAEIVRDGRAVAELVPRKAAAESSGTSKWPPIDFRARFLKMPCIEAPPIDGGRWA